MKASTTLPLYRRICAPPELNIRIFDPITSYFAIASFILHLNQRYFKRIRRSLYSIPADCKSAGTLALLVLFASTTFAYDFNSYNYFNYSNYRNRGAQIRRHISLVDYYRKHYVCIWIFHSSLFVLHLNKLL